MRRLTALLAVALASVVAPSGAEAACSPVLPVSTDPRASIVNCTGVHVGMLLSVPSKKWGDYACAASYAFTDQFGTRYLTFPGSCFLDYDCLEDAVYEQLPPPLNQLVPRVPVCINPGESEEEPFYRRQGPVVTDYYDGRRVGTIVYAVNKDGVDFALLRVDKEHRLEHSVPFYGGPLRGSVAGALEEARVYSPGNGVSPNAHAGLMSGTAEVVTLYSESALTSRSGTTVMRPNGDAIGFVTMNSLGWKDVQPLGEAVDRAIRRTRLNLRLMTAPLKK